MIGNLKYEEINNYISSLQSSSDKLKELLEKYPSLDKISNFCNSLDSYVRFLTLNVELYADSEKALSYITEKINRE